MTTRNQAWLDRWNWLQVPGNREKARDANKKYHKKIRDWLDNYKVTYGCVDCGYRGNPKALQFDHVRGECVS